MKKYISHKIKKLPKNVELLKEKDMGNIKSLLFIMQSFYDDHYEIFLMNKETFTIDKIFPWINANRCWIKSNKPTPVIEKKEENKIKTLYDEIDFGFNP
jgi:hypothetical protein